MFKLHHRGKFFGVSERERNSSNAIFNLETDYMSECYPHQKTRLRLIEKSKYYYGST